MGETNGRGLRIVALSWDRAHEELTAIVQAESSEGVVVREVVDLCEQPGRRWIRRDEIVDLDDLAADDPVRRLAQLRGTLDGDPEDGPVDLTTVLRRLAESRAMVGIFTRRTGSGEMLVGLVERVSSDHLVLAEVDTSGASTGDELRFDLDEVIGIEWGTGYLTALGELLAARP